MTETPYPSAVNHPIHYNGPELPIECIEIAEHFSFCRGNAIKYLWRAGNKGDLLEDLYKARWYVDREITRLEREREAAQSTGTEEG
jgi:hypothetical protein